MCEFYQNEDTFSVYFDEVDTVAHKGHAAN